MILAIDYGTKRIGLAIADEKIKIPLPLREIFNKRTEEVVMDIVKIIQQEKVDKVVVGIPLSLKGTSSKKTEETQKFIDILAKKCAVPVVSFDERLTSKLADNLALEIKGSRDIGAAMVILEDFLSRR